MFVYVCVCMRVRAPLHDYVSIHISTSESHDSFFLTKLRMRVVICINLYAMFDNFLQSFGQIKTR